MSHRSLSWSDTTVNSTPSSVSAFQKGYKSLFKKRNESLVWRDNVIFKMRFRQTNFFVRFRERSLGWNDYFIKVRWALALAKTTSVVLLRRSFCVREVQFELDTDLLCTIFLVNRVQSAFVGKLLSVMDVFLCCIIKGLHGALMTVPEPVPTSLHEEGFAVWMWECVITLYVQCNEREKQKGPDTVFHSA